MSETAKDRQPCAAHAWDGVRYHPCRKTGKVERAGKWYCGIHDPARKAEKEKARSARWDRERDVLRAQQDVIRARNAAADLIERGNVTKAEFAAAQDAIKLARKRLADLHPSPLPSPPEPQ